MKLKTHTRVFSFAVIVADGFYRFRSGRSKHTIVGARPLKNYPRCVANGGHAA